jgi:hypothetical protein
MMQGQCPRGRLRRAITGYGHHHRAVPDQVHRTR